ncbi:hypothetical protein GCM10009634_08740 [Saccharothrix xinjiangensis]
MAVLRSEADFTDPGLSRDRRLLALHLLVHLVDEHGRMSDAYRRVLKRAADDPGHWAHGRSPGAVRAEVARWIGVGARQDCRPPWDRVADLVEAVVEPGDVPEVLATARYLHRRATGERGPAGEPLKCPDWVTADHVTTTLIGGPEWARRHRLVEVSKPEVSEPEVSKPEAPGPEASEASEAPAPGAVESRAVEPEALATRTQVLSRPAPAPDLPEPDDRQPATSLPEPRAAETPTPETPTPGTPTPGTLTSGTLTPETLTKALTEALTSEELTEALTPDADPTRPDQEQRAYELLWSVVRVHRETEERHLARIAALEEEVLALRAENARLTGDVTSWLGSYRPDIPSQRRRDVASRHLALEDPAQAFTYPLPAELPDPRA